LPAVLDYLAAICCFQRSLKSLRYVQLVNLSGLDRRHAVSKGSVLAVYRCANVNLVGVEFASATIGGYTGSHVGSGLLLICPLGNGRRCCQS